MKIFGFEISVKRNRNEFDPVSPVSLEDLCQVIAVLQTQVNKIDKKVYRDEVKEVAEVTAAMPIAEPQPVTMYSGMATAPIDD